ncbi:MAG: S8 family serine peptidase [Candidatus Kapabacteria bacterium]|nr:S8 family serine peptidase [Candidatus Kapabacteria bacterium]
MFRDLLFLTSVLLVAVPAMGQTSLEFVRILPTKEHPIVFANEVFVESDKNKLADRQNRENWYAAGRYIIEVDSAGLDESSYNRIAEAIRPFSTAEITSAANSTDAQVLIITFAKPESVVRVEAALRTANVGYAFFANDWTATTGVPNDRVFDPRLATSYLYANGAEDLYYHHALNSRTRAWAWFSIKAPMAWGITKGNSEVAIGIIDNFKTCQSTPVTTDVSERTTVEGNGNVRRIVSTITSANTGIPVNIGNGVNRSSYPIKAGHGYSVLGAALAKADNDPHNPNGSATGSSVGSCPECSGVLFPLNPPTAGLQSDPCLTDSPTAIDGVRDESLSYDLDVIDDFDLDFTNDASGKMKRVDILNCSYVGGNGTLHKRLLRNGVAIVAAAGNDWGTAPFDPAATLIMDPQPGRDTKILAVGAITDGTLLGSNCQPWGNPQVMAPVWKGAEQFTPNFAFSPDSNKFSVESIQQRESTKRGAYMDIVAPGGNIWTLDHKPDAGANQTGYTFQSGTSISTALVSGVVGLMFSINPNMGVVMDSITDLPGSGSNGLDVQRRMYNVVTFTADKIADLDPAHAYKEQVNDSLRRSWARRMGFGKINAYRAVAHSISLKGEYEYTSSGTLSFDEEIRNSDGIKLMHWGSRIKDGIDWPLSAQRGRTAGDDGIVDVLQYGGRSLPGEPHNNQGVTRLTSSATPLVINVPNSSTLCIDGMLLNEGSSHTHQVVATGDDAMILAEGLVRNISLVGRLNIGDLIVDGTSAQPVLNFTGAGEIYGFVQLSQRGAIVIEDSLGSCRMRPGSHVRIGGTNNLSVKNGGELLLDHASRITRSHTQEVDVRDGATLRVLAGAKTHIGARVRVRAGSRFVIEDSAVVFLHDLIVEPGGSFIIHEGAHVAFGDSTIDINGHMAIIGGPTPAKRITLTTEIADNCTFDARSHRFMSTQTRILVVGSTPDWQQSSASLQFTDLKNVSVQFTNVSATPVYSCAFSMNRDFTPSGSSQTWMSDPFMFSASTSIRPSDAPDSYNYVAVIHSTFTDSAGAVPVPSYQAPYNQSMSRYSFSGIHTEGLIRTDVTGCSFAYVHEGVVTASVAYTTVNASEFSDIDLGVRIVGGQPRICGNNFTTVEYPATLSNSDRAYHNDNAFNGSRVAVRIDDCAMQAFRNNDFTDYWRGIVVNKAVASLTSLRQDIAPYELEMYGRNRFDVTNAQLFAQAPLNHPNPFMRRADAAVYVADASMMSDLFADHANGVFLVRCGKNRFGEFTTSHVAYENPTQIDIDFSINNCRPLAEVRTRNVAAHGAPLNVEDITDKECGPQIDEDNCSDQVWRDGRNEILEGVSPKRGVSTRGTVLSDVFSAPVTKQLSISIEECSNLIRVLTASLANVSLNDTFIARGLTGEHATISIGTHAVDVVRNGVLVQRIVLLVTP